MWCGFVLITFKKKKQISVICLEALADIQKDEEMITSCLYTQSGEFWGTGTAGDTPLFWNEVS